MNPVNCLRAFAVVTPHKYLPCRSRRHIYRRRPVDTHLLLWLRLFRPDIDFVRGSPGSTVVGQSWQRKREKRTKVRGEFVRQLWPSGNDEVGRVFIPRVLPHSWLKCFEVFLNLIRRRNLKNRNLRTLRTFKCFQRNMSLNTLKNKTNLRTKKKNISLSLCHFTNTSSNSACREVKWSR